MTNLQTQIELLSSNKDVQQGIKNMLVKLRRADEKGTDWRSLDKVEEDYFLGSSKTIAIELVPAWATLEDLATNVKVVLLDSEAGTSEILQMFWIGEQGVIEYL